MHVYQYTVLVHFGAITDMHVSEPTSGVNNNKWRSRPQSANLWSGIQNLALLQIFEAKIKIK